MGLTSKSFWKLTTTELGVHNMYLVEVEFSSWQLPHELEMAPKTNNVLHGVWVEMDTESE